MNRRTFMTLASGLLVPAVEPARAYSFIGGWREQPWGYAYWTPRDGGKTVEAILWEPSYTIPFGVGNLAIVRYLSEARAEFSVRNMGREAPTLSLF
jgi:hypothetical protein